MINLGDKNWGVKDSGLLAYKQVGSKYFNKDFDFTRASNGTYVDKDGVLQTAELYNLIPYSQDFTEWLTTGSPTLTSNYGISPFGIQNSTRIQFDTNDRIYIAVSASGQSVYSIYMKGEGQVRMRDNDGTFFVDITLTPDWVRYELAINKTLPNVQLLQAVGTSDLEIFGAQLVEGTEPLDYQYTNGLQGLPRISFEDGVGHLLLEPQTTQLVPYSEDFSQWTLGGNTAIEGGYLAPDGTNNAYKVSGSSGALLATGLPNLFPSSTRSIYARTVNGTGQANLMTYYGNTNNLFTITEQWQRFDINSAISTGATSFYAVDFRGDTNISEIILWGANATNDQTYPTSYIKTEGTSVTRLADVCNNSGSAQDFNSEEGVLYAEIAALADDATRRYITISNGSDSYIRLTYTDASNKLGARYYVNGTFQCALLYTITDTTQFTKAAFKYKENDFALWVNGVEVASDTSGSVNPPNTFNRLDFINYNNVLPFYGKVRNLQVFTEALGDTELMTLTGGDGSLNGLFTAYKSRVEADGGYLEAETCLINELKELL